MSSDREALLERFRAGLLSRIERVEALLGELELAPARGAAPAEALGELHTLKGEARMLGLTPLSELTHALEGRLSHDGGTPLAFRVLEAMRKALSPHVEPDVGDAVLEAALLELGDPSGEGPSAEQLREPGTDVLLTTTAEEVARGRGRRYVQVDSGAIDELCERLAELSSDFGKLRGRALITLSAAVGGARARAALLEDFARVTTLVSDSTTRAWSLRLVPVEPVLRELRRHARMLATENNKALSVRIEARGVELERNVLDQLWDSLLHLVQNAVDHGLEPEAERGEKPTAGSLLLSAQAVGPSVVLRVEDDGRGIDLVALRRAAARTGRWGPSGPSAADDEVLDLVFDHGFSTREEVSTLSGRGVGLAVVKQKVEGLGGEVKVESTLGAGTRFSLTVPFTISKERSLVVGVGAGLFGFPARTVRAVLGPHELPSVVGDRRPLLRFQGESVPLVSLAQALELPSETGDRAAIVVELGGHRFALGVPRIVGDSELIRRPADALLGSLTGIAATASLEDGRLVLMLDVGFLQRALRDSGARASAPEAPSALPRRKRVLIADDSPVVCQLVQEILVSAGYAVEVVNDGTDALRAIQREEPDLVLSDVEMPKMGGFELLTEIRRRSQKLPVVMLTTRGSVEDRQLATSLGANAYLLKTGFKSDALLDVVMRFLPHSEQPHDAYGASMKPVRALVIDDSSICRDRLRDILTRHRDIAVVGEAENGDRVLELIRRTNPTILLVDLQMPGTGGQETIERVMANHPLPILVVTGQPSGVAQKAVFESIRRGALDLAEKPGGGDPSAETRLAELVRELSRVPVVRHMAGGVGDRRPRLRGSRLSSRPPRTSAEGRVPVAAIGASAGGPLAVALVVAGLPVVFPAAVAVVQHLPKGFAQAFAEFLRARTLLPVMVVTRRTPIRPGQVYVACDDRHLVASDAGHFAPGDQPEIDGHRPSVDALFHSLSKTLRGRVCGVVMSGIGRDGTSGLMELKQRGALTLAQDEASSGVYGMPRAALEAKAASRALDPAGLSQALRGWATEAAEESSA